MYGLMVKQIFQKIQFGGEGGMMVNMGDKMRVMKWVLLIEQNKKN